MEKIKKLVLMKYKNPNFVMYTTPEFENAYKSENFEVFSRQIFYELITSDSNLVDVGGHYGFYSLLASTKITNGKIFSFEPSKESIKIFENNIKKNSVGNIRIAQNAVSDKNEKRKFYISEFSDSSGFTPHPRTKIREQVIVDAVCLDDYLKGQSVDIVKIDTEGHELEVLNGMLEIINNNPRIKIFFEFNPKCIINAGSKPEAVLLKVKELDFMLLLLIDRGKYIIDITEKISDWNDYFDQNKYVNILCVKKNVAEEVLSSLSFIKKDHDVPKTSVIITCHNYGKFLSECINSVIKQNLPAKEIIVVNDASDDETEKIALSYGDKIKYFSVQFRNAQKTRNYGLQKSNGEYVVFLDADDYFRYDFLQKMQTEINENDEIKLVYSDRIHIGRDDILARVGLDREWTTKDFNFEDLKKENYISLPSIIRKKEFIGFDEEINRYQDWEAWLTFLNDGKAKRIAEPLFAVRFHGNNKTLKTNGLTERIKVLIKHKYFDILASDLDACFREKEILNLEYKKLQKQYKKTNELQDKNKELEAELDCVRSSKFWKLREKYLKFKFVIFSPIKFINKYFFKTKK